MLKHGTDDKVMQLIKEGVDVTAKNKIKHNTPLHITVSHNRSNLISAWTGTHKILLYKG